MKINTLNLTKTVSDFLFLWVENPEEKAKDMFIFKHTLTPHGFEKYIEYYFSKIKGFKMTLNGNTFEMDNWIDLKWIKCENDECTFSLIQCKKYTLKDVTLDHIAHFYGKIIDKIIEKRSQIEVYYITTSKFTQKAKDFWKEKGIFMIDFFHLYQAQKIYTLDQFKKDILDQEGTKAYEKSFESTQKVIELYENYNNIVQPTQLELFTFLRQIRRDYSHITDMRLWDIASNQTLTFLSRERPHNLASLKTVLPHLPIREQKKLLHHGEIFLERLKYFHISENELLIEQKNSPNKNPSVLQKLLNFF